MGLLRDAVKDCSLAYVSSEDDVQNIMASLGGDPSPTLCPAPFVVFSVTLFRRDVFRKVGLFNEGMTQAEDRDICLRAYCKGFQSFYISTAAYDINRGRLSDVPVTTPLRQYLRGLHKKLSYTPTHPRAARRQTLTSVLVSREVCRHKTHSVNHVPAVLAQESII